MPDGTAVAGLLVRFGAELRAAGLAVGSGDVVTYCTAMTVLDPADLADLYWAGRAALIRRRADTGVYDQVFRRFFLADTDPAGEPAQVQSPWTGDLAAALQLPAPEPGTGGQRDEARLGWMASDVQRLRRKSFAACTPQELAALRRIMAGIRLAPPRRRTRRTCPAGRGRVPDLRRTIRESLRSHGEPARLFWRQRRLRPRPLILILDISGSMAAYSRSLLQFGYAAKRSAARVEVFCFGTRLTRITKALEHRRPDEALDRAAGVALDWEGGTRIGASLEKFVRDWGRRGLCRGGVVVICSDGLDRGDPAVLAAAMERLSRLCHRVVWMNPHKGDDPAFRPSAVGMIAAAPYVDELLSGHDLASLEQLARLLPRLS